MLKLENKNDVEIWLVDQPREVSIAIASRTAIRVFPIINRVFLDRSEKERSEIRSTIVSPLYRANALSWAAAMYPYDKRIKIRAAISVIVSNDVVHAVASTLAAVKAASAVSAASATEAASAALISCSAAATSTSAAFTAVIYKALSADADVIDKGGSVSELIDRPLWPEQIPQWFEDNWRQLQSQLSSADATDENWQVWTNWFNARITGTPAIEKLELARATIDDKIWKQGPKVVNAHIQELIDEFVPKPKKKYVFISYNHNNLKKAEWIGNLLVSAGYSVFAQFNDMPPGSNFVREMQKGLKQMDRMIAVLSPDYEQSDQCQAEWAAAYNVDPSGTNRLLIPVMVEAVEVNALANQIVYIPAHSMSEVDTKQAILAAVRGESIYASPIRKAIADAASPAPSINSDEQLHAGINVFFDQSEEQNRLVELLETQQAIIRVLLQTLPEGAPSELPFPLQEYQAEIAAKGVQPSIETLDAMAQIFRDMVNGPRATNNWITDGWQAAFNQFEGKHNEIMEKFPHKPLHDQIYEQAEVNEEAASGEALTQPLEQLLSAVRRAHDSGLTTDEFLRVVEKRRDFAFLLGTVTEGSSHDGKGVSNKKRAILQDAGFVDKAIERGEKVANIASSDAGKAFLKTAGEVGKALWKFITT